MNVFIHDDFLLETKSACILFHEYAKDMPIIDYHCHLPPEEVAMDKSWENISQVWLYGDHYKWRAMRSNGINEKYCTGDASDREKFDKFAETMQYLLRNPIYHWSQLELARYFNVIELLEPDTADYIWNKTTAKFASGKMTARKIMKRSNVRVVCTTDDPTDSLEHHIKVAEDGFEVKMLPTWRPDKSLAVDKPAFFNAWVDKLADVTVQSVTDFDSMLDAIKSRHDFFANAGCKLSDYGVGTVYADDYTPSELTRIFKAVRSGSDIGFADVRKFQSAMLHELAAMDAEKGWARQLHMGALRNNNTAMFKSAGADKGFDSIGDWNVAENLSKHLDRLAMSGKLGKTVLYNLNPCDNEVLATMIGNFQDGSVAGKMQFGSGWWFLDQKNGMEHQIEALSQLGLLSRFVGMLTDSRSFLSYTRHEYFRRILCNILGNDMEKGLIPRDYKLVGNMVKDISFNNANEYFGFGIKQ